MLYHHFLVASGGGCCSKSINNTAWCLKMRMNLSLAAILFVSFAVIIAMADDVANESSELVKNYFADDRESNDYMEVLDIDDEEIRANQPNFAVKENEIKDLLEEMVSDHAAMKMLQKDPKLAKLIDNEMAKKRCNPNHWISSLGGCQTGSYDPYLGCSSTR